MNFNNMGQLLPVIDTETCIECGLCYTNCPGLDFRGIQYPKNEIDPFHGTIENVYVGRTLNEDVYRNSQSGGMVTAILLYLFKTKKIEAAIVCRVEYSVSYTSQAVVVTDSSLLYETQKSSYTPIDMVSALKKTTCYSSVAFVGTGCHIQGVKALQSFNSQYNNVKYKLGLICDRTLSKTVTDVLYGSHFLGEKKKIIWRDKTENYRNAKVIIENQAGLRKEVPTYKRFILKEYFTPPRCRICFDKLNVHADIVLGDPWGMSGVDWDRGMSVVIVRNKIGREILSSMQKNGDIDIKLASLDELFAGQYISQRKENVKSYSQAYLHNQWMLPSYYSFSKHITKNVCSKSKKLLQYNVLAMKSKEYICKKINYAMNIQILKQNIKDGLRKLIRR